jgi:hypothetical protein
MVRSGPGSAMGNPAISATAGDVQEHGFHAAAPGPDASQHLGGDESQWSSGRFLRGWLCPVHSGTVFRRISRPARHARWLAHRTGASGADRHERRAHTLGLSIRQVLRQRNPNTRLLAPGLATLIGADVALACSNPWTWVCLGITFVGLAHGHRIRLPGEEGDRYCDGGVAGHGLRFLQSGKRNGYARSQRTSRPAMGSLQRTADIHRQGRIQRSRTDGDRVARPHCGTAEVMLHCYSLTLLFEPDFHIPLDVNAYCWPIVPLH